VGILDGWRFCPRCAGKLAARSGHVRCAACGFTSWANSVPGAQAVIEHGGRVLLGRRAHAPSRGLWDLPGGFLDEGEHPLGGLRREVLEETGCEIEPIAFLGFWIEPYDGRSVLCLTWLATLSTGAPRAGDDLAELRWFGADEIPRPDELAFPTFVEILERWRSESSGGTSSV
jgi:ADP-ribose pyrophosphatase YjhB (NUDIX family)